MLDVALIELVSAGLRRFFSEDQNTARSSTEADDGALLRRLLVASPEVAGALVNRCVADQWHSIQANQLPTEIATEHLARLPRILAADRTSPDATEDFFAQSPIALADAIILATDIDTSDGTIDETILTFLLEVFLRSLQASRTEIETLLPLMAGPPDLDAPISYPPELDTLADALPPPASVPRPRSDATLTLEKIARADALAVSVPILELITVAVINRTRSPHLRQADLADVAAKARAIRAELAGFAVRRPFGWSDLDTLVNTFDAGRLDACSRTLTAIEEEAVRQGSPGAPRAPELVDCAIQMRLLRARLYALQGNDIAAARQMGHAQRHVPRTDHARRWQMAIREARHYEHAAYHDRDPAHFDSAARACSSAFASLSADTPPALRAEIQSELAHYLIRLGHIELSSSRFEIAAQLLEDAVPNLGADDDARVRLLALIRQGDAVMGLARLSGADHLSGRAVASYEAASHLISTAADGPARHGDMRRPFDEGIAALRARLAVALLSRSASNEDASLHETALDTIADVLPSLAAPHDLGEDASFSANLLAGQCHYAAALWLTMMGETDAARQRMKAAVSALEDIGCNRLALELSRDMDSRWSSQAMALCAEFEATGPATAA